MASSGDIRGQDPDSAESLNIEDMRGNLMFWKENFNKLKENFSKIKKIYEIDEPYIMKVLNSDDSTIKKK